MTTTRETLQKSLSAVDFPADKEQLVDYARNNGADDGTVSALRAMPPAEYENLTEVVRSVPLDKAEEEGQSDSDKARQDRQNVPPGVAEHQRQAPVNPIEEELGENRRGG
ncbi:DUF2795 domain-containing protein [Saccharopolyspora gloriosae]|uniref:DUF2795 domain-containing protein n=1 Tax=Saccharopolyspora gloriosae TaxID=455344 RepID=UPI001FB793DA|nr:DUF2795 domain-containing protein [Saccharopolyspora gloriosae]